MTAFAQAKVLFYEGFDYSEGGLAGNSPGGAAWANVTGDANNNAVQAASLIPPSPFGFVTIGDAMTQTASARAALALYGALAIGTDNTVIYVLKRSATLAEGFPDTVAGPFNGVVGGGVTFSLRRDQRLPSIKF